MLHDLDINQGTAGLSLAPSTTVCGAPTGALGTSSYQAGESSILQWFQRCRTGILAVACVAIWSILSSGNSGSAVAAFAHVALPMANPEHTAAGMSLAAQSAWAGLAAGVLHTLCGPDHLAGLAPLSIGRSKTAACALGALWGFGHSTGQMILGLAFALLKEKFDNIAPIITKWSGIIVPLTLIIIGMMGIYETCFNKEVEDEEAHSHDEDLKKAAEQKGQRAIMATYATGIVHGLQPDALFVVIPALALPTQLASISYISMFVLGTIVAMAAYTLLIGASTTALTKDKPWLQSHLSTVASAIAISVGGIMLLAEFGLHVPLFS